MGQMEDLHLFTLVVENRSISKAADQLNIAKSAVSRRLNLLEERYSAKLINRSPGRWDVTETGLELYQRATRVVDDFEEIEADFKSVNSDISGPLTVSVPRDFGLSFLSKALVSFKEKYDNIQLTADFDDRLINLESDNYDFAIRITPNLVGNYGVETLGIVRHHLCAAQSYLDQYWCPETLQELKLHKLIHFGAAKRGTWKFNSKSGKKLDEFEFSPSLNSNSGQFLFDATLQGQGIANLPDFILGDALETGKLVPILCEISVPDFFIYLIHSDKRRINRRMRLFSQEMKLVCEKSNLR